ncbi:MAG: hypothetical protein ACK5B9_03635 [Flavobacteriia bacterium]|jgi:hypothetical protein
MKLHNLLCVVARRTSSFPLEKIEELERRADDETNRYLEQDKGFKGLYAKLHKGWLFPLLFLIAEPLLVAWLTRLRNGLSETTAHIDDEYNDVENPNIY